MKLPRLRAWMRSVAVILLAGATLAAAGCSDDPVPVAQDTGPAGNGVCVQTGLVDHTEIKDDSTILFLMKGGTAWKNTLRFPCVGLSFEGGFTYPAEPQKVCSNDQTIQVLHAGTFCELGQFTPYTQPATSQSR